MLYSLNSIGLEDRNGWFGALKAEGMRRRAGRGWALQPDVECRTRSVLLIGEGIVHFIGWEGCVVVDAGGNEVFFFGGMLCVADALTASEDEAVVVLS